MCAFWCLQSVKVVMKMEDPKTKNVERCVCMDKERIYITEPVNHEL